MSDNEMIADEFRRFVEQQTGAVYIGPDIDTIEYTFDGKTNFKANYFTLAIGGFNSAAETRAECVQAVMGRVFMVAGNPIRLQKAFGPLGIPVTPSSDIPAGSILIWRDNHFPVFVTNANSIWSATMSWTVLAPYAKLVDPSKFKTGA